MYAEEAKKLGTLVNGRKRSFVDAMRGSLPAEGRSGVEVVAALELALGSLHS